MEGNPPFMGWFAYYLTTYQNKVKAYSTLVERPNPKKSIIKGDNWSDKRPYETMHRFHPVGSTGDAL